MSDTSAEHIATLQELHDAYTGSGFTLERAALLAGIAAMVHGGGVPDMREWFLSWPDDIRRKLSCYDLQRMWKTLQTSSQTAPASVSDAAPLHALAKLWKTPDHSDEEETEFDKGYDQASMEHAEALTAAIAQQPGKV